MLGAVMGSLNGLLIVWGGIPSIIVTLGTMAIYRGLLVELSGAKTVTTASLPDWIVDLPHVIVFRVLGIDLRVMVALALLLVVIAHFAVTSDRKSVV